MALEWRPPLQKYVEDPDWKRRLDNHVSIAASVQTVAVQRNLPEEDPCRKCWGSTIPTTSGAWDGVSPPSR